MVRHREFQCVSGVTAGKNKKNGFPIAGETRTNEGFVIYCTPEDTIAILEPVMVGQ